MRASLSALRVALTLALGNLGVIRFISMVNL